MCKKVFILIVALLFLIIGLCIFFLKTDDSKNQSDADRNVAEEEEQTEKEDNAQAGTKLEVYEDDSEETEDEVQAPSSWDGNADYSSDGKSENTPTTNENEQGEELVDDEVSFGTIF